MHKKSQIVFFLQSSGRYELKRLKGVYEYAKRRAWHVMVIDRAQQNEGFGRLVQFWKPIGCIAEGIVNVSALRVKSVPHLPVVFCDVSPAAISDRHWLTTACFVKHDAVATTRKAYAELMTSGWHDMAFAGDMETLYWSRERQREFQKLVAASGRAGHVFTCESQGPFTDVLDFQSRLKEWLANLPKPCGILAVHDFMGEHVIFACRELGLSIPDQIMVVGIDNEELRCEHANPTLSSVEPDFEKAGYLAAQLLDELSRGVTKPGTYRYFGPARVVRRRSTMLQKMSNAAVQKALEKIRIEACSGLRPVQVLTAMGGSRSSAERLFRQVTGCSVYEKIEQRRLEEVLRQLANEELKIETVASLCGYKTVSFLRMRFREKFGMSMAEWRLTHKRR